MYQPKSYHIENLGVSCDHCEYIKVGLNIADIDLYVGKPCPQCGYNLLTQEDCNAMKQKINRMNLVDHMTQQEVLPSISNISVRHGFKFDTKGNVIPLDEDERKALENVR